MRDKKGLLSAKDAAGTLEVATPPAFGGVGQPWTPEHYFLSAISSCFMTTLFAFAKKLSVNINGFECGAIGQIEIVEGKYKFTKIDLYPKVYIEDEASREATQVVLEKTHKYCLITNSINAMVYYHSEILVDRVSRSEVGSNA